MKQMKFREYLVGSILSGAKTATHRLYDDKDFQAGDTVEFINKDTLQRFALVTVTHAYEKLFKELDTEDFLGNQSPLMWQEYLPVMQKHYGAKAHPDAPVKIVRFKLIDQAM